MAIDAWRVLTGLQPAEIERAEQETQLTEKRYQAVDPANRLVAATLERRWNAALQQFADLQQQVAETEY
ncbi:MAG: hypothetical protein ACREB3_01005, partial [Burkholderiales bacterium]